MPPKKPQTTNEKQIPNFLCNSLVFAVKFVTEDQSVCLLLAHGYSNSCLPGEDWPNVLGLRQRKTFSSPQAETVLEMKYFRRY